MNAAKYAAGKFRLFLVTRQILKAADSSSPIYSNQAGAKEAASKTELAMLDRQILGFKEEVSTTINTSYVNFI